VASALNLSRVLFSMTKNARSLRCSSCQDAAPIFPSPASILSYLAQNWDGHSITISAEARSEEMLLWADIHGFTSTDISAGRAAVTLDSGICDDTMTGGLSGLVKSLLLVPDVVFVCITASSRVALARYGWCQTCLRSLRPPRWDVASRAISRGHDFTSASEPEFDRILVDDLTLRDILERPVESLAETSSGELREVAAICASFGLGNIALGASIQSLTARQLATLSLITSVREWKIRGGIVMIDLPRGLAGGDSGLTLATTIHNITRECPTVVCSSGLFDSGPIEGGRRTLSSDSTTTPPLLGTVSLPRPNAPSLIIDISTRVILNQSLLPERNLWGALHSALIKPQNTSNDSTSVLIRRPFQLFPISVFQPRRYVGTIIARQLGLMEALSNLCASSLDAKSLGLRSKDFTIDRSRKNPYLCSGCGGLGVLLDRIEELPRPLAHPCPVCSGKRYSERVRKALFKGSSLGELLNRPIIELLDTLRALPKASRIVDLILSMELGHLPLGMPMELLSDSELRAFELVVAVTRATKSAPSLILIEEPTLFLGTQQLAMWDAIFHQVSEAGKAYLIEVTS